MVGISRLLRDAIQSRPKPSHEHSTLLRSIKATKYPMGIRTLLCAVRNILLRTDAFSFALAIFSVWLNSLRTLILERLGWKDTASRAILLVLLIHILAFNMIRIVTGIISYISNFFNGIPGPLVAKTTVLWKLYHLRHGTYEAKLAELHKKSGILVQVGPGDFSISDLAYFERCSRLQQVSVPVSLGPSEEPLIPPRSNLRLHSG